MFKVLKEKKKTCQSRSQYLAKTVLTSKREDKTFPDKQKLRVIGDKTNKTEQNTTYQNLWDNAEVMLRGNL